MRFVTSMSTFPAKASPTSAMTESTAVKGTARMTTSAAFTASAVFDTARAPVSFAFASACAGSFALNVTVWPARTLDFASAPPTFPAPMMAIFIRSPLGLAAVVERVEAREYSPMRVFVTGATGFVMGAVARALRARGDAVVALVRSPSRAASLSALGCELVAGDVVDPSGVAGEIRGCDALIHGAAIYEIGVNAERRRDMEETNVTGTRRVLDAARAAGISRTVYVSTIAAFGNTHGAVVAEGHRPTSPPTSAYEDTKRRAHEIALDAARSRAPIVIVQPGQVYGPNGHSAIDANFRALAGGR